MGENRTPITTHADVVADLSAPLAALINNGVMTESTTRVAVIDDVEAEVFRKLCQFAYTGSYSIEPAITPSVTIEETPTSNDTNLATANDSLLNDSIECIPSEPTTTKIQQLEKLIATASTHHEASREFRRLRSRLRREFLTLRSTSLLEHRSNSVYKTHILVYTFATKYLIEPLRQKSLDYFHFELVYNSGRLSSSALVKILDYIYHRTTSYQPGGPCAMRDLIIRYAAGRIRELKGEKSFEDLVAKRPEIPLALFNVMTE